MTDDGCKAPLGRCLMHLSKRPGNGNVGGKADPSPQLGKLLLAAVLLAPLAACDGTSQQAPMQEAEPQAVAEAPSSPLADLQGLVQICTIPDPLDPSSAFNVEQGEPVTAEGGWMPDYWVRYSCKETCADYQQCAVPTRNFGIGPVPLEAVDPETGEVLSSGAESRESAQSPELAEVVTHGRDLERPKPMLAFVADRMGGYLSWSDDGYGDAPLIYLQDGGGGTQWSVLTALDLERSAEVRTAMVRWADGFRFSLDPESGESEGWGFLTRTQPEASNIRQTTRRVAAIMAWIHENMAGPPAFGAMACSMGTNAIIGPVLFHGLDDIIDYQSFTGGPFFWDVHRACNLPTTYEQGFCAADGTTVCADDGQCAGEGDFCQLPGVIANGEFEFASRLYESAVNHMHAANACDIGEPGTERYADFDNSSYGLMQDLDWNFDHRVDLLVDVGGATATYMGQTSFQPGDEFSLLGHFMQIFNRIEPAANRRWHMQQSHHCNSYAFGKAAEVALESMGLQRRPGAEEAESPSPATDG